MNWLYNFLARLRGRNLQSTPTSLILEQLNEPRPLPVGRAEFEEWSDRIVSGTMISALPEDQKFVLCNLILGLGSTKSVCEDAYFIHSLRKVAANQVADAIREELKAAKVAKFAAEKAAADAAKVPSLVDAVQELGNTGPKLPTLPSMTKPTS
jgi:hypothetical protein